MTDDNFALLPSPKIFRFAVIDQFRNSVRALSVDFTPLVRSISAEQTILSLPGCDVNFTKSFPRITDAQLVPDCTAVAFMMDDGAPMRFNGAERGNSVISIGGGGAFCCSVETTPRQYVTIIFYPQVMNRGWPETGANFHVFETSRSTCLRLRGLVRQILAAAWEFGGFPDSGNLSGSLRESLLAAIDSAVAELVPVHRSSQANASRQFKIFRDIEAALSGHVGDVIYSEQLAQQIGVPVRTMYDAVQRYRGMSLHRYLRLRRLWLVRRRLVAGAESVKAAALAYGFWHLSDFSHAYREQYGEMPSETLARWRQ